MVDRSISLRKNILPGLTTLEAKAKRPIRDSSSRLVHFGRLNHCLMIALICCSLSAGSRMVIATESGISIPKYVIVVVGPTSLSSAMGTPKSLQIRKNSSHVTLTVIAP